MKPMKKLTCLLLALLMAMSMLACTAQVQPAAPEPAPAETTTEAAQPAETATEKPVIKFYGKCIEYTSGPMMTDALEALLQDTY